MKKVFRNVFQAIPVLVFMALGGCQSGAGGESAEEDAGAASASATGQTEASRIVLTRAQFEGVGMNTGDPEVVSFQQTVDATGYVRATPQGKTEVSVFIPGRVKEIGFSLGEYLARGEKMFFMEGNEIIQLQQEYAKAFHDLRLLESIYKRQQVLSEGNVSAGKELVKAESEYRSMLAQAEGLKARLKLINIDPRQVEQGKIAPGVTVNAPSSGVVTRMALVRGAVVEPYRSVAEIIDTTRLGLYLHVFEKDIAMLAAGQNVTYYDPGRPGQVYGATLLHVGRTVDGEKRTIECVAVPDEHVASGFVDGSYVQAAIITCYRETLALPSTAVITENDLRYVLILEEEKDDQLVFRKNPVKTGVLQDPWIEVLDTTLHDVLIDGSYYF